MLKSCFCITKPHFIGKRLYLFHPDAVQDDMHMDIPALVMSIVMGADQHLMSGEMLFSKRQTKFLRLFHRQSFFSVFGFKADNVMVSLYLSLILIFPILFIYSPALSRKVIGITVYSLQKVFFSNLRISVFIPDNLLCSFIVFKNQVTLGFRIVRIFTGDMFNNRHYISPAISSIFFFSWLRSARQ